MTGGNRYGFLFLVHINDFKELIRKPCGDVHGFKTCGAASARGDGFNQTYLNGDDMARLLLEEMEQDAKEGK